MLLILKCDFTSEKHDTCAWTPNSVFLLTLESQSLWGGGNWAATGNPELEATGSLLLTGGPHGPPVNNYILEQSLGKSRQVGGDGWAATAVKSWPSKASLGKWAATGEILKFRLWGAGLGKSRQV